MNDLQYGYIIQPDGVVKAMPRPENENGTFTLRQLQNAVGGYIEHVQSALATECGKSVLVDEEGLLKQLKPNIAGSVMCSRPVVGNVVVIREELWE